MDASVAAEGSAGSAAAGSTAAGSAAAGAGNDCPSCGQANAADALFCEACGYDFTTGAMPQPLTPPADPAAPATPLPGATDVPGSEASVGTPDGSSAPALEGWVAEVWVDPDWYAAKESTDPLPSPGVPLVVKLTHTSVLIGRASRSRGITPDVDLSTDNGISRRHAQLTTDGSRWWVEDLGSSNGTYVGAAAAALPSVAISPGEKREIASDARVYLGAWTRLIIRRAAPGEV